MSDQRYSTDLIVTAQDFAECNWKSTLANEGREGCSSMWQAFSSTARKASEDDLPSHGKALRLLVVESGEMLCNDWGLACTENKSQIVSVKKIQ